MGMLPVTPAAITGVRGGCSCQRLIQAASRRLRRSTGSTRALLRHDVGPDLGQDAQELQGLLPVLGKLGRDQAVEALQGHVLGRDLVEEAHQLAGEADRLLVLDLAVLGEDELGEQEVAAQRRQGGEQLELGLRVEQQLVGLQLAHGLEARKEQGAAACGPHHRVAQGEAGAPAGQKDQRVGESLDRAPQQLHRHRIQERQVGRDSEEGGHAAGQGPLRVSVP